MVKSVQLGVKQALLFAAGLVMVLPLFLLVGLDAAHAVLPHVEHVVAFAPRTYWMD
jgi:hypothetical protein